MAKQENQKSVIKVRTNYVSTIISISLVLFMLGVLGIILLNAKKISDHVKENIGFSLYLKEGLSENDISRLQRVLEAKEYTNRIEYINKEEAAEIMKKELGEDFVEFLDFNPLSGSVDLFLNAAYAEEGSAKLIETELKRLPAIKMVDYQMDLIAAVNKNVKKIGLVLLGFSILLLIVVIALINNTIRLAIYSKRFLIKTMQLVGATGGFIRRPFVARGVLNGFISGVIAIVLLSGVMYSIKSNLPEFFELQNFNVYGILFGLVVLLGILISWVSTSLAVRKFLRMQSGDLY
ncbi:MAG: permease-like cell division protein FtsX [Vicingaceae bacterium]|jgi:cell division transport system permease protein|tara:strand:- start:3602 stop:4477 length:876 start_codon:yes stop_codon:yes gene_type:complete